MSGQHTMDDVAEIEERLRRDLAEIADRIGPPIGDGADHGSSQVRVISDEPAPSRWFGRPVVAAAAAVVVLVLAGGMLLFARDGDPDRINTVPPTSGLAATIAPVVTASTVPEVTTTTVAPSPDDEPGAPAENAQLTPQPAVLAAPLSAPVAGETQQSIVGDITWTSVQGDITTLPSDISFEHEGVFYANRLSYGVSVQQGQLEPGPQWWTSTDGVTWTPWTDAPPDTAIDRVGGTLWASERRWDGTEFVAVEFPPAGEVPGEGLTVGSSELSAVAEFDGRLVVKRSETFEVPWADLLGLEPPFEAREQGTRPSNRTFRVRAVECTEFVGGRQCGSGGNEPTTWVIRPEIVQGAPTRIDFYDNNTDELITSVVPPDDGRPIDDVVFEIGCCNHGGRRSTFFIADSDGTNARLIDGPLQDPPFTYARFAELDGRLFALTSDDSGDAVQLWVTDDFDAWEQVGPPATIEQWPFSSTLISDGSTMIVSVGPFDQEGRPVTHRPFWTTTDGADWTAWESPLVGYPRRGADAADFGWMDFHDYLGVPGASVYESPELAISPDGETWQTMPIPVPAALSDLGIGWADAPTEDQAGGWGWEAYAHGDTIFVVLRTDLDHAREIWVGHVISS